MRANFTQHRIINRDIETVMSQVSCRCLYRGWRVAIRDGRDTGVNIVNSEAGSFYVQ